MMKNCLIVFACPHVYSWEKEVIKKFEIIYNVEYLFSALVPIYKIILLSLDSVELLMCTHVSIVTPLLYLYGNNCQSNPSNLK